MVSRDLSQATDAQLLEALGRLDVDALAEIYRRHAAAVYVLAHQVMGAAAAQEATQDVFLYLWDHADELKPVDGTLRPVLLEQLRVRHFTLREPSPGAAEDGALTEQEQAALDLALGGAGYKDTAARLGVTPEVVDGLLRGALLKIYDVRTAPTEDPRAT